MSQLVREVLNDITIAMIKMIAFYATEGDIDPNDCSMASSHMELVRDYLGLTGMKESGCYGRGKSYNIYLSSLFNEMPSKFS